MNRILLFLAQGFGVGPIPFAPGTSGSVLGLGWFALQSLPGGWGLGFLLCASTHLIRT